MEIRTWNPAEIPDDTLVYVPNFGETTVGELRGEPDVGITEADMLEQTAQMWSDIINEDIRWRRDPRGISLKESRKRIQSRYMKDWADRVARADLLLKPA